MEKYIGTVIGKWKIENIHKDKDVLTIETDIHKDNVGDEFRLNLKYNTSTTKQEYIMNYLDSDIGEYMFYSEWLDKDEKDGFNDLIRSILQ